MGFITDFFFFFPVYSSKSYLLLKEEIIISSEPGWPPSPVTTMSVSTKTAPSAPAPRHLDPLCTAQGPPLPSVSTALQPRVEGPG